MRLTKGAVKGCLRVWGGNRRGWGGSSGGPKAYSAPTGRCFVGTSLRLLAISLSRKSQNSLLILNC